MSTITKATLKTATLSIPFVRNQGQIDDPAIAYYADTFACRVSVTKDGQLIYGLSGDQLDSKQIVRERLVNAAINVTGQDRSATQVSYTVGNDPNKWHHAIPSFDQVSMGHIYKGVRLALKAHSNNVEKLFYVTPGADPSQIRLSVDGVKTLQTNTNGELELISTAGKMRFSKPVAYQTINGKQQAVAVRYQVQDNNTYGFSLGSYDINRELVIDPLITSFPIIVREHNDVTCLAADSKGNVYAAGFDGTQCFIFKFDNKLKLINKHSFGNNHSGSFYGGDMILDMAIDSQDNIFVTGKVYFEGYPVTNGCYDNSMRPPFSVSADEEGILTKFSPELKILASTFIGGDNPDRAYAIAIDSQDNIYVTGVTMIYLTEGEARFPTTVGAYDTTPGENGNYKAFVVKLDNKLEKLLAGTLLGGNKNLSEHHYEDVGYGIAIDSQGNVWVTGQTFSPDFPITQGSVDSILEGESEAFVAKFDANLQHLLASTFLGGNHKERAVDIVVTANGEPYVGGWTESSDFPTVQGCYDTKHGLDEEDSFVVKLSSDLKELKAATLLGGDLDDDANGDDELSCMALSADGSTLVVAGRTESKNFPTTPKCYDSVYHGGGGPGASNGRDYTDPNKGDGFITAFNSTLTQCLSSTYFGGGRLGIPGEIGGVDYIDAILINGNDILVAGQTYSDDFPLMPIGDEDSVFSRGFISRFNSLETPSDNPDNPDTPIGSRGGGGGGCFIESTEHN